MRDTTGMGLKDVAVNNFYYGVSQLIADQGASLTLLILGVFLAVMTLLKTLAYFASSAVMIPLRTGVVRDIRRQVYNKVLRLPLAFFSEERKGDIIARMSGDVTEVETYRLFRHDDCRQLATDRVHTACSAGHGLGDGYCRQETEAKVARGTEQVERHDVPTGGNLGRFAHH